MNINFVLLFVNSNDVKENHVKLGMKLNHGPWHVKLGSLARHWRWNKGEQREGKGR